MNVYLLLLSIPLVFLFVWVAACLFVATLTKLIELFVKLLDWLMQPEEPAHYNYTFHDIPIRQYPEWNWNIEYQTLTPADFYHHRTRVNWQREGF